MFLAFCLVVVAGLSLFVAYVSFVRRLNADPRAQPRFQFNLQRLTAAVFLVASAVGVWQLLVPYLPFAGLALTPCTTAGAAGIGVLFGCGRIAALIGFAVGLILCAWMIYMFESGAWVVG
ncbi:MAG: hypothetical protein AB7O59_17580 [Pirellulales bacterium]